MNTSSRSGFIASVFAAAAAVAVGTPALGQVVLFNTITKENPLTFFTSSSASFYASSFTTAPSSTDISDVKVKLNQGNTPTGTYTVSLWSDVSFKPGVRLYDVGSGSDAALNATFTVVDFPGLSLHVAANTRYWIVVENSSAGGLEGGYFSNTGYSEGLRQSSDSGANWGSLLNNYGLAMSVTSVPEPASEAGCVALGLLALGAYRLRSKKA